MRRLASKLLFLSLLPLALASQGCNTYSYFDLDLKTKEPEFTPVAYGRVVTCRMFVTGAVTETFSLDYAACHLRNQSTGEIGRIQYATFADSGSSLTFTLRLFGTTESESCLIGHGETTLTVDGGKTVMGEVNAAYDNPPAAQGCN
jgi:hypothetical protein